MKTPFTQVSAVVLTALLFTILFYKQHIGLNLFLFELVVIGWLFFQKRIERTPEVILTVIGTLITGLMVVVHNSILSIVVNWMSLFLMTGVLLFPKARALTYSLAMAVVHMVRAQIEFGRQIGSMGSRNTSFATVIRWIKILVIPLFVIFVFAAIYSKANPIFDGIFSNVMDKIYAFFDSLSEWVEFGLFWCFILGLIVADFLLLKTSEKNLARAAENATDELTRKKGRIFGNSLDLGLKSELRSGVFLLGILNALLLLVNAIDIHWVWLHFEWNGDYLKQFVHEGTYLLIISILVSIGISMYLFRGNQNFYKKSGLLGQLTVLWLVQNGILAISVAIRNIHYIQYYALAHLRIGVFFFLLATLVGLAIVIFKIRRKKTFHFVLRTNAISVYSILILMTCFNWDVIIAKYNFKHYETTFTHFDFLSTLSYSALTYQEHDMEFLAKVEDSNSQFPSDVRYMDRWTYGMKIRERKAAFKEDWEKRDWRSWNWAYSKAYAQVSD